MVLTEIPEGVRVLKTYKGTGLTLLECTHPASQAIVIGVKPVCCKRPDADGGCCGDPDPEPEYMCPICKGDEQTTQGMTLPVKMLLEVAPEALQSKQEILF